MGKAWRSFQRDNQQLNWQDPHDEASSQKMACPQINCPLPLSWSPFPYISPSSPHHALPALRKLIAAKIFIQKLWDRQPGKVSPTHALQVELDQTTSSLGRIEESSHLSEWIFGVKILKTTSLTNFCTATSTSRPPSTATSCLGKIKESSKSCAHNHIDDRLPWGSSQQQTLFHTFDLVQFLTI